MRRRLAAGLLALLVLAAALAAGALAAGQAAHHCDGDDACPVCMGLRLAAGLIRLLAAGAALSAGVVLAAAAGLSEPAVCGRAAPGPITPVTCRVRLNE